MGHQPPCPWPRQEAKGRASCSRPSRRCWRRTTTWPSAPWTTSARARQQSAPSARRSCTGAQPTWPQYGTPARTRSLRSCPANRSRMLGPWGLSPSGSALELHSPGQPHWSCGHGPVPQPSKPRVHAVGWREHAAYHLPCELTQQQPWLRPGHSLLGPALQSVSLPSAKAPSATGCLRPTSRWSQIPAGLILLD